MFLPILKNACMKMEIKDINVLQGRSFLQLPLNLKNLGSIHSASITFSVPKTFSKQQNPF